MTELGGDRVQLRPFRASELDRMVEARERGDAGVPSRTPVERSRLRRRLDLSGTMTDHELLLAVETDGRLVGEIQARKPEEALPRGVFELGIEIYEPGDRGHGYGSEAASLLTSHLFEREDAHRVQASTDVDNVSMRRVLERLGFAFEGVLRGFMLGPDGPRDYAMYGVTAEDHRRSAARQRARTDGGAP